MNTKCVLWRLALAGMLFALTGSTQGFEQRVSQAEDSMMVPPCHGGTADTIRSTQSTPTSLGTEIRQLRGEVGDLRRDVQRLIQLLEAHLATLPEREEEREEHPNPTQGPPDVGQSPENTNNEEFALLNADGAREEWNLGLQEAVRIGLANCPGVMLETRKGDEGDTIIRSRDADAARMEAHVSNLIGNIEDAYVDLWVTSGELRTMQQARDATSDLWQQLNDNPDSPVQQQAAAREQYFCFRTQMEESLQLVQRKERQLRAFLGLITDDGRVIVPAGLPERLQSRIDLEEIMDEAYGNSPIIQQQIAVVRQCEQQLTRRESAVVASGASDRRDRVELRKLQQNLAREQARLGDIQQNVQSMLTSAVQNHDFCGRTLQSHRNRRTAVEEEIRTLTDLARAGKLKEVDLILDAQRRWVAACKDCFSTSASLISATRELHRRKGTLLSYHRISILE